MDNWSDFEKYVFHKLNTISDRLSKLEGRAALFGGLAGALVAALGELIINKLS